MSTRASPSAGLSRARVRRVAVTTLAEFACRRGDLDGTGVVGPSAREGQAAHQRLQAESDAESEVRLMRRLVLQDEAIELSGRIDLLDRERRALGEIKSTLVPAARVPAARRALHRAQLMLYGWLFLGEDDAAAAPVLEVIYVNLRGGAPVTETVDVDLESLERHATEALQCWLDWQRGVERRRAALAASAATLAFPHARFRDGQRTMSVAIYRCLRDGTALLCEAPTGTGKTVSSLYPALRTLGEGRRRQVMYLTAKVSGRQSANDALGRLAASGARFSAVTLRSRATACFCENGDTARDADGRCPMTKGFHDRLPAARAELVEAGVIDAGTLDACARRHALCPHALAARLLPWMDVIVGDYNHVFDPLARLAGLDEPSPDTVLLIDEAHNLLERSRAMFSAALSRRRCVAAANACERDHPRVARPARALGDALLTVARGHGDGTHRLDEPPAAIARRAGVLLEALAEAFAQLPAETVADARDTLARDVRSPSAASALPPEALALWRELTRFAVIAERYGDDHRTLLERRRAARTTEIDLRYVCVDAAPALSRQRSAFGACVMFSATLAPATFYRDALGLPVSAASLTLPSPFDRARALHCIVPWVDTRYRGRDASLGALVELVRRVSETRAGNHLVFLSSYAYLERVHAAFARAYPRCETWRQWPGEDPATRSAVLARLERPGHRVGFAILGGGYGEGVDYAGERLIGVIVVGTGLPAPSVERELIVARYREQGLDGFDFASRVPGFTRVQQTVGRLIRGERDRGVVVLVDDRFEQPFYRRLFPAHWNVARPGDCDELEERIRAFWKAMPGDDDGGGTRARSEPAADDASSPSGTPSDS